MPSGQGNEGHTADGKRRKETDFYMRKLRKRSFGKDRKTQSRDQIGADMASSSNNDHAHMLI